MISYITRQGVFRHKLLQLGSLVAVFFVSLFGLNGQVRAEIVAELTPHRAIYDLVLDKATKRSGISGLSARMVYELKGSSCEGYTLNIRVLTTLTAQGGKKNLTDIRISSFEAEESESYQYNSQQLLNQVETVKTRGTVVKSKDGIKAIQELPEKQILKLPQGSLFPNEHRLKILLAAKEGKRSHQGYYFDGSDGLEVFRVSSLIGKGRVPGTVNFKSNIPALSRLKVLQSWPIIMSYFKGNKSVSGEQTPAYEMALHMFENGVSSKIKMSYVDFSMTGELTELEFFPPGRCE